MTSTVGERTTGRPSAESETRSTERWDAPASSIRANRSITARGFLDLHPGHPLAEARVRTTPYISGPRVHSLPSWNSCGSGNTRGSIRPRPSPTYQPGRPRRQVRPRRTADYRRDRYLPGHCDHAPRTAGGRDSDPEMAILQQSVPHPGRTQASSRWRDLAGLCCQPHQPGREEGQCSQDRQARGHRKDSWREGPRSPEGQGQPISSSARAQQGRNVEARR